MCCQFEVNDINDSGDEGLEYKVHGGNPAAENVSIQMLHLQINGDISPTNQIYTDLYITDT